MQCRKLRCGFVEEDYPSGRRREYNNGEPVNKRGELAPFSSIGNTADGRVKPDVVAVGLNSDVMGTDGNLRRANGTSFSSPIMCGMVACLWQACPRLTAKEVIELVRSVGDRSDFPDNIYGYGIPDLWKAYQMNKK